MDYIISGEMTEDKLRQILNKWNVEVKPKLKKYYNYYIGKQAISTKTYVDPSKPCNRIITNYCHQIVEQYLGFNIGIPITYEVPDNIRHFLDYNDVTDKDNLLLKNALIFGKAFELQYLDEDKKNRFNVIDTRFGIDVYSDELEKDELKYFIRLYCINNIDELKQDNWRVELVDKDKITTYKASFDFALLDKIEENEHNFNQVPVVVFNLNDDKESIFAQIMSLQDAYNTLLSSEVDDWEAFCDAYMVLKGVSADDDEIAKMKENRVILIDNDADAKYLIKDVNDNQIEGMLTNIKEMIFKLSNSPDFTDKEFNTSSGVSLQYKLIGFSNVSKAIVSRMERAVRKRIELFQSIENIKDPEVGFEDIYITFTQNIPDNIEENAEIVVMLQNIVSNETLLKLLPFVKNPEEEIKKLLKEREDKIIAANNQANSDNTNPEEISVQETVTDTVSNYNKRSNLTKIKDNKEIKQDKSVRKNGVG